MDSAPAYNDLLIESQTKIAKNLDSIFNHRDIQLNTIKKHRKSIVENAEKGIEISYQSEAFDGDSAYRDAAKKYYFFAAEFFDDDELDSSFYYLNNSEKLIEIDSSALERTLKNLDKYVELEEQLLNEQQKFAENHKLRLTE